MTPRNPARLAAGLGLATGLLLLVSVAAAVALLTDPSVSGSDVWSLLSFVLTIGPFSVVGGLIASRRPDNPIGWLMSVIGLLFAVVVACSAVSRWGLETGSLPEGVGEWISVGGDSWVPALGLIGTQLPLRLPDGQLLSRRWRTYSRVTLGLIAASFVAMAIQPGRVEDVAGTANPLGVEGSEPVAAVFILVILSFVGATASLVVRYRRANAHERTQLRWIRFGGVVFITVYLVTLLIPGVLGIAEDSTAGDVITSFSQAAFSALPIAIGFAVLRNRLYDIDVVVNRALVYGALTATLAATYVGTVLLLQLALSGITQDSGLAVAASTLAVAGLFRPARARIQGTVDRRFYRHKYDAQRTLERFGAHVRDDVELSSLTAELRAVVADTMQPAHVSLWLPAPRQRQ